MLTLSAGCTTENFTVMSRDPEVVTGEYLISSPSLDDSNGSKDCPHKTINDIFGGGSMGQNKGYSRKVVLSTSELRNTANRLVKRSQYTSPTRT